MSNQRPRSRRRRGDRKRHSLVSLPPDLEQFSQSNRSLRSTPRAGRGRVRRREPDEYSRDGDAQAAADHAEQQRIELEENLRQQILQELRSQIEPLFQQNQQLMTLNEDLNAEIDELTAIKQDYDALVRNRDNFDELTLTLQHRIEELRQQCAEQDEELAIKEEEIQAIQIQMDENLLALEKEYQNELSQQARAVEEMSKQLEEQAQTADASRQTLAVAEQQLKNLESEIRSKDQQNHKLDREVRLLASSLRVLQAEKEQIEQQCLELQDELENVEEQLHLAKSRKSEEFDEPTSPKSDGLVVKRRSSGGPKVNDEAAYKIQKAMSDGDSRQSNSTLDMGLGLDQQIQDAEDNRSTFSAPSTGIIEPKQQALDDMARKSQNSDEIRTMIEVEGKQEEPRGLLTMEDFDRVFGPQRRGQDVDEFSILSNYSPGRPDEFSQQLDKMEASLEDVKQLIETQVIQNQNREQVFLQTLSRDISRIYYGVTGKQPRSVINARRGGGALIETDGSDARSISAEPTVTSLTSHRASGSSIVTGHDGWGDWIFGDLMTQQWEWRDIEPALYIASVTAGLLYVYHHRDDLINQVTRKRVLQ